MKRFCSPFFWVAFAMVVGGMSTALISPLYPLYQEQWRLQVSDISLIYVVYMLGALSSLLFLGRLADLLGFDRAMRLAMVLLLAGTTLTVLAWNVPSLLVGRFIVGVSASVLTIAGSVGLIHLSAEEAHPKVSMFTSVLLALGFGLGPLLGGVTGQWIAYPLITTYVPVLLLGAVAWAALLRLPRMANVPGRSLREFAFGCLPRLTWPELRRELVLAQDVATDPLYQAIRSEGESEGRAIPCRSAIAMRFSLRDQPAGVFFLRTTEDDVPLNQQDVRFAEQVITAAVTSLERAYDLERAVTVDKRLGGHIVQGHVDGIGTVESTRPDGFSRVVRVAPEDPSILRYVVEKGSIAVDGVSLTVSAVDDHGFRRRFRFRVRACG